MSNNMKDLSNKIDKEFREFCKSNEVITDKEIRIFKKLNEKYFSQASLERCLKIAKPYFAR